MKIGINAVFLVPGEGGGIERYLRNLVRSLQGIDDGNEYVLFTNRNNSGTFDLRKNFREYLVPVSARFRPMKILWEQLVIPFQVKRAGIEVLLSPGNISPLFLSCPSIAVMHDLIPFKWPENFTWLELYPLQMLFHFTAKRVDRIITVSQSSKQQIVDKFDISPHKVNVIYEACDEVFLRYKSTVAQRRLVSARLGTNQEFILYTASTRPHKNVGGLLEAFSRLKNEHAIEHCLVIAGSAGSDHDHVLKLAVDLGIRDDVIFTGYISDDMLPLLYSKASLVVYPSFYEGFGLPVLEAMACGTPVLASNTTSLPEVVGNAGVLVSPYNVGEMADAMYTMLSDKAHRNRLIARGKKRAQALSWEKTAKGVLDVLRDLYNQGIRNSVAL